MKRPACPFCGYIPDNLAVTICPKCDSHIYEAVEDSCLEVDVAHRGQSAEDAIRQIDDSISRAILLKKTRIRFVCGYGSAPGHTAIIRARTLPHLKRMAARHGYRILTPPQNPGEIIVLL